MKSWIKIEDQYTCPCCASEFDAKQLHMKVFCNCPACAMPLLASMDREAQYVQMNSLNNITMKEYGDNYTATEQAYKNGYEQGKKDAVKHGRWNDDGRCTECDWYMPFDCEGNSFETQYCPHCGAKMDGERKET